MINAFIYIYIHANLGRYIMSNIYTYNQRNRFLAFVVAFKLSAVEKVCWLVFLFLRQSFQINSLYVFVMISNADIIIFES